MKLGDRVRLIRPNRHPGLFEGDLGTVVDEPYLAHSGTAAVVTFDRGGDYPCYHFEVEVIPPTPFLYAVPMGGSRTGFFVFGWRTGQEAWASLYGTDSNSSAVAFVPVSSVPVALAAFQFIFAKYRPIDGYLPMSLFEDVVSQMRSMAASGEVRQVSRFDIIEGLT